MNTATNRFDELLPFYVNGTLAEADREWVEAQLREHPQAAAELDSCRTLQARIRADVPTLHHDRPPSQDVTRITELIAADEIERACAMKVN